MSENTIKNRRSCLMVFAVIGFVCLFICFVVVGIGSFWHFRTKSASIHQVRTLRDAGEPTSGAELNEYYDRVAGSDPAQNEAWMRAISFAASKEFEALLNSKHVISKPPSPGQNWSEIDTAKDVLKKYEKNIAAVEKLCATQLAVRYPVDFVQGMTVNLDHTSNVRNLARLLKFKAYLSARQHNSEEFVQSVVSLLRTGKTLEHEPTMVSSLVSIAVQLMAVRAIQDHIGHIQLTDAQQSILVLEFQPQSMKECLISPLRGERAIAIDMFFNTSGTNRIPPTPGRFDSLKFYLQSYDELMYGIQDPSSANLWAMMVASEKKVQQLANSGPVARARHSYALLLMPSLSGFAKAHMRNQFNMNAVRIALSLDRYRQETEVYPDSLDSLVPKYLSFIPLDPFDDKTIRYLKTEQGFRLYSVGADLIDHGGIEDKARPGSGDPDYVFEIPFQINSKNSD